MTEITLHREFEYFFCPITGQQILQPDDYMPSPATAFIFYHAAPSFIYLSEKLQNENLELYENEARHGELYLKLTEIDLKRSDYIWITFYNRLMSVSRCFNTDYEFQEEE